MSVAEWLARLIAMCEDSGSNHTTDGCVCPLQKMPGINSAFPPLSLPGKILKSGIAVGEFWRISGHTQGDSDVILFHIIYAS